MEINYEEKIVSFIDVLGFSNLVFASENKPIETYYQILLTDFKEVAKKHKMGSLLISDSVVIHIDNKETSFNKLVRVLCMLQHKLFHKGILIRGGISSGKLFIDEENNVIVGTGLINAYKLEGQAMYPRIIIDRSLIKEFYGNSKNCEKVLGSHLRFSAPEPYHYDFPYLDYCQSIGTLDFQVHKFESIIEILKKNFYKNEHITKYQWLRSNLVDSCICMVKKLEAIENKSKNAKRKIRLLSKFIEQLKDL